MLLYLKCSIKSTSGKYITAVDLKKLSKSGTMDTASNSTLSLPLGSTLNEVNDPPIPTSNSLASLDLSSTRNSTDGINQDNDEMSHDVHQQNTSVSDILLNATSNANDVGIEPFLGDASYNASTLNALDAIHQTWIQTFNMPLSSSKEDRIKQAVNFMNAEENDSLQNRKVKKHSYRQIALYFKIPKSTLYDRLKHKSNNGQIHSINKVSTSHGKNNSSLNKIDKPNKSNSNNGLNLVVFNNASHGEMIDFHYKSYEKQMKLTFEKEEDLLSEIKSLCLGIGNIMNRSQINSFVKSKVSNVRLGKTWFQNFLNRHKDKVLYGFESSYYNVTVAELKNGRNNSAFLWKCYINEVKSILSARESNKPIYFIIRTNLHKQSRSSIFTVLKITNDNYSIKLLTSPKVIVFQEFFNCKGYFNFSMNSNENSPVASTVQSPIEYEKIMKLKNKKLTKIISDSVLECVAHYLSLDSTTPDEKPLILFEGFDEQFNWDIPTCKKIVDLCKFMAVPWKEQLFQEELFAELNERIFALIQGLTLTGSDQFPVEFDLENTSLDLEKMISLFKSAIKIDIPIPIDDTTSSTTSSINQNKLPQDSLLKSNTHSSSTLDENTTTSIINSQIPKQTINLISPTPANIFENNLLTQVSELALLVDQNENTLFEHINDPRSKAILNVIFTKIKNIAPR